jgi:hypothetical protein
MSPNSQKVYAYAIANFSTFHGRSPDKLGIEHVRQYRLDTFCHWGVSYQGFDDGRGLGAGVHASVRDRCGDRHMMR